MKLGRAASLAVSAHQTPFILLWSYRRAGNYEESRFWPAFFMAHTHNQTFFPFGIFWCHLQRRRRRYAIFAPTGCRGER